MGISFRHQFTAKTAKELNERKIDKTGKSEIPANKQKRDTRRKVLKSAKRISEAHKKNSKSFIVQPKADVSLLGMGATFTKGILSREGFEKSVRNAVQSGLNRAERTAKNSGNMAALERIQLTKNKISTEADKFKAKQNADAQQKLDERVQQKSEKAFVSSASKWTLSQVDQATTERDILDRAKKAGLSEADTRKELTKYRDQEQFISSARNKDERAQRIAAVAELREKDKIGKSNAGLDKSQEKIQRSIEEKAGQFSDEKLRFTTFSSEERKETKRARNLLKEQDKSDKKLIKKVQDEKIMASTLAAKDLAEQRNRELSLGNNRKEKQSYP